MRIVSAFALAVALLGPAAARADDPAYSQRLVETARREGLARDPQWLRLGHYRPTLLGGYKSQVDGPEFFLSRDGRRDPARELEATLEGFFAPDPAGPDEQHPQCRFPARYLWLKSRLAFDPERLPDKRCPRFEAFRDRVAAKSATVVFSSYYLNNPSSAFGHTFLRLNRSEAASVRSDLTDYAIEYAATVDTGNALLYAYRGLTGGFKGEFAHYPYYYKVRLYNDYERRDLWEYDLALAPEQVRLLVAHLWEVGSSYFDYYYVTENCSYHILTLLEAADPHLDLVSKIHLYVIPADTVKALYANPGLVQRVRYRPSIWTQFGHRVDRLGPPARRALEAVVGDPNAPMPEGLGPEEQAAVLDAALDYVDAKFQRALIFGLDEPVRAKQQLLRRRAAIRVASPELPIGAPTDQAPQGGHGSARAGLAAGYSDRHGVFERAEFRFALHDLADRQNGYPEYSQIEFGSTRLRYNSDRRTLWLEDFALFRIVSLSPFDTFNRQLSWKIETGATTIRDKSCDDCLAGTLGLGGGLAHTLLERPRVTWFLTLDGEVAGSPEFRDDVRLGVGPAAGLRIRPDRRLTVLASASWKRLFLVDADDSYSAGVTARWHLADAFAVDLEGRRFPTAWEGSLGLLYYF